MFKNMGRLPARGIPTPFGKIHLPAVGPPKMALPEVDSRRLGAAKHAVASDFATVFGYIPVVGNLIGEGLADMHYAEMKNMLEGEEFSHFLEVDKVVPTNTLALLYSFVRS